MPKKDLYMATCIEELNKQHSIPDVKSKKCKLLCTTANKAFEHAEYNYKLGDDEYAYILFMKYLNIIHVIRDSNEYKQNKADVNKLINVSQINHALNFAEELSTSLTMRYRDLKTERDLLSRIDLSHEDLIPKKICSDASNKDNKRKYSSDNNNEAETNGPKFIRCNELYSIMAGPKSYLLIDIRSASDFEMSHVVSDFCINIPEKEITPGKSAGKLALCLSKNDLCLWKTRGVKDFIILIDQEGDPGNCSMNLSNMYKALVEWDPEVTYKEKPVAVKGGYAEFIIMYPTKCTNPKQIQLCANDDLHNFLDDIVYPVFNEMAINNQAVNTTRPDVDRNSKPTAMDTYDERTRNMADILSEQEKIVDNSILLEKRRLDAEHEWECLRLTREKEAEEEKRRTIQEHLQLLQQTIMQMDSFQRDKIMENEALRKQLEEYKQKEKLNLGNNTNKTVSDSETTEFEIAYAKRIEEKEREREKLDKQRENLARERQRKLDEAKAMKQESMKRYAEASFVGVKEESPEIAGMKRSLSTPNVAQLDLDIKHISNVPKYDRTAKPNIIPYDYSIKREYDIAGGKGLCGLRNLGNTCYMNSILQCLSNTCYLMQYFSEGAYREHINRNNETKGRIAEELASVIRTLWSGQYKIIASKDFRNAIGQQHKLFRGNGQQDSHEFLTILMDLLHLDLQIYRPRSSSDNITASDKAWKEYTSDKESLILKFFYGQIRSTVTCIVCAKESITFDTFSNLSLELPASSNRCSLSDCLNLYFNSERISGWKCPECKDKREAVKKLDIARLPPILIIHFKRFYVDSFTSNTYHKKQTYIDFPITNLHIKTQDSSRPVGIYNLYAVSNHYGSMESGHYTAYCKSSAYNKWYKFDDHMVNPIDASDVNSSAAYILFYTSFPERSAPLTRI